MYLRVANQNTNTDCQPSDGKERNLRQLFSQCFPVMPEDSTKPEEDEHREWCIIATHYLIGPTVGPLATLYST